MLGKGSNKFFLDKYNVVNVDDKDSPTKIKYEFRIGDYFQKVGDEIYVNMNLRREYYDDLINLESRKAPIEKDFQFLQNDFIEFQIPAGYEVEYLPPDSKLENSLLGYSIEYKRSNDKILYSKKLHSKFLMVSPSQFKEWNEVVGKISEAYRESVILKKKSK
jgi:hypothetical protein